MAILSKFFIVSSFLSSLALAVPLNKREVVWEIITETAWTTVDVTTTVYEKGSAPTTSSLTSTAPVVEVVTSTAEVSSTPAVVMASYSTQPLSTASSSSADAGAQFYTTAASSSSVLPTTFSTAVTSSDLADTTVVPKGAAGECVGPGSGCSGDVTHWDGGLGACGFEVNTETDYGVALPVGFMGDLSNTNPYCKQTITLINPTSGTTVNATVVDKCMGCAGYSIDCTNILFEAITDGTGDGRVHGIEWYLN